MAGRGAAPMRVADRDGCRHHATRRRARRRFASRSPSRRRTRAGQHYVVRLTAPDGYTASRSYSVASAPDGSNEFELTVERFEDGEVSTFLHDDVVVGDELEVRGPIGGWFVWDGDSPALLVGGGSGIVPLMAMLRSPRAPAQSDLVRLVVSVRTPDDLYYASELPGPETQRRVHARRARRGQRGPSGDSHPADIVAAGPQPRPRSSAAHPVSATPRPISCSAPASRSNASASSASARRDRPSVHLGHERLVFHRRANVVVGLAGRELQRFADVTSL